MFSKRICYDFSKVAINAVKRVFWVIWLTNRVFWVMNTVFRIINRVFCLIWLMLSIFSMFNHPWWQDGTTCIAKYCRIASGFIVTQTLLGCNLPFFVIVVTFESSILSKLLHCLCFVFVFVFVFFGHVMSPRTSDQLSERSHANNISALLCRVWNQKSVNNWV